MTPEQAKERGIKVKPLVWDVRGVCLADKTWHPADYEAWSEFGRYTITQGFGSDSYHWDVRLSGQVMGCFDDPETAKAATQTDYEARILDALE